MKIIRAEDVAPNVRRGGEIRTLLSPSTVGSTSGFMGLATMRPGEVMSEHYHPYSEEFVYVVQGALTAVVDGERHRIEAGQALFMPVNTRHRLLNEGEEPAELVFHLGPLAPRPELGHVDTEPVAAPDAGTGGGGTGVAS